MENCDIFDDFRKYLAPGPDKTGACHISPFAGASDAFAAISLARDGIVLAITPGLPQADRLLDDLLAIGDRFPPSDRARILDFPPVNQDDKGTAGRRNKAIAAIESWREAAAPLIVVAPFAALATGIPCRWPDPLELNIAPACGQAPAFEDVCAWLAANGYTRTSAVEAEGEYSVRGGILDAWCPGEESPARAEFFGDELESLRLFDPATQVSSLRISKYSLIPCGECDETAETARPLGDILPDGTHILALDHDEFGLPLRESILPDAGCFHIIYSGQTVPEGCAECGLRTSVLPGFSELGGNEAHHPELFEAARARLDKHIAAARLRGKTVLKIDDLSGGFETQSLIVVTKADRVFTKRRLPRRHAPAPQGQRIDRFEELEPGELVVHVDHGIGRFRGSSEVRMDGKLCEVFTIEYADGALLHVPAAHAHLISRYVGVKGAEVRLHRLDGRKWDKDKADAQRAVADFAAALLETQARRQVMPAFAYDVHCDGIDAFEAAFPFSETEDQLKAIAAIKEDMASTKPMDRLICGDAGYGKTEVAMRAAYIAAMNGKQVAVLAPTTMLAEQHFETFTSRFDGTPVRIEAASRLQSAQTRDGTFQRVSSGVCDIIIGTHAILSSKLVFHDLGLIIIDEEQRFGVRQKEHLKRLRATADVLALSATPIPRTLYLSMTGARDLSILSTPPRERVAVETKIMRDSDEAIRSTVETELARGGQIFYLHNRVATIASAETRLQALCPKAKITMAHGQMDAATLAKKIRTFERGRSDILLSTTIVESGIDIPRANTIIVERADTFGLADLYQLRGRVGRSSRKAFAYMMLPPSGDASSEARERLRALQRHAALGAGFSLALRDLELRGAGNLLGDKQSGHIAAIGFTLYCQLLQRTIARLKGEKPREIADVRLNLDFMDSSPSEPDAPNCAAIPYQYIEDDAQRMTLLRRFAEALDEREVRKLAREMADRFGPCPESARRFVKIASIRAKCASLGIGRIDSKDERAIVYAADSGKIMQVIDLPPSSADARIKAIAKALEKTGAACSGGEYK